MKRPICFNRFSLRPYQILVSSQILMTSFRRIEHLSPEFRAAHRVLNVSECSRHSGLFSYKMRACGHAPNSG